MAIRLITNKGKAQILPNVTEVKNKINEEITERLSNLTVDSPELSQSLVDSLTSYIDEAVSNSVTEISAEQLDSKLDKTFAGEDGKVVVNLNVDYTNGVITFTGNLVTPATGETESLEYKVDLSGLSSGDVSGSGSSSSVDLGPLTGRVDTLESTVSTLGTTVNTLESTVNTLNTTVSGVSSNVSTLSNTVSEVSTKVEGFSTSIEGLTSTVDGISTTVGEMSTKVDEASTKADEASTKVNDMSSSVETLTTTVDGISSDVTTLKTTVSGLETSQATQDEAISELETDLAAETSAREAAITELRSQIVNIETGGSSSLDTVMSEVRDLLDDYVTTETYTTGMAGKVDTVEGKGLSTNDLTDELKTSYDGAVTNSHTHTNKEVLDSTTASYTTEEKTKLSNIEEGAQVNTITEIQLNGTRVEPTSGVVNIVVSTEGGSGSIDGSNLKTINGESLVGTGDIELATKTNLETLESTVEDLEDSVSTLESQIGTVDTTGNAGSATKLATPIKVELTGGVIGSVEDFDGSSDLSIATTLSQTPSDYPTLNQDTTGNAATAGTADYAKELSQPISVRVNLTQTGTVNISGNETEVVNIPITGVLPEGNIPTISYSKLTTGAGTGTQRQVLATNKSTGSASLDLATLDKEDVGLENVLNAEQATKEEFEALTTRVDSLEQKGVWVGSFETESNLPSTSTAISNFTIDINDFATVRDYSGSTACFTVSNVGEDGTLTWTYDFSYSSDATGKVDRVTGAESEIPVFNSVGNLESSGKKVSDFIENDSDYQNVKTLAEGARQSNVLIGPSDITTGETYNINISGNAATATTADTATNATRATYLGETTVGSATQPIYLNNGTPTAGTALGDLAYVNYPTTTESITSGYVSYNSTTRSFTYSQTLVGTASRTSDGLMSSGSYQKLYYPYIAYIEGTSTPSGTPTFITNTLITGSNGIDFSNRLLYWSENTGNEDDELYYCSISYSTHGKGNVCDSNLYLPEVRVFLVESANEGDVSVIDSTQVKVTEMVESAEIDPVEGTVTVYSNSANVAVLIMIS